MMKDGEETRLVGTLLAGLLIGTGLGMLFAPQSGQRTREDIGKLGRITKDLVWDFQESLKESIDRLIEDTAEVTRDSLEKGKKITDEKKKKILELIESGEKLMSAQKENLQRLLK